MRNIEVDVEAEVFEDGQSRFRLAKDEKLSAALLTFASVPLATA